MEESTSAAIAIVEDEYIVALDIKTFLEKSGYRVAGVFSSGDELLAQFEQINPDLVLMDIRIKGQRDGVETARLVHERWDIPVILLTAYADEETLARAKVTQPFGYLIKPFEGRELRISIEVALYRAQMEKKLHESETRYRRLFEEGPSGNFLVDRDWHIVATNAAFRKIFGLADPSGLPELGSLFRGEQEYALFRSELLKSGKLERGQLPLRVSDGSIRIVFISITTLSDSEGHFDGAQGELNDVTETSLLEERLAQSQKMEAVGRFAGGIAHDFNNILTAIIGYSNLLGEEIGGNDAAIADLDGIRNSASKASALTRQLLVFSRRQPVMPREIDLNAVVSDTEVLLRRLVNGSIAFRISLESELPSIFADSTQVEQVIMNLVLNARDAMPQGGQIGISTGSARLDKARDVGLSRLGPGRYAVLAVSDTGSGIDPAIIGRIFDPFFTTKSEDKGTGLGLSTVYGIVKQCGGSIEVSSKLGEGSVFRAWFPCSAAGANGVSSSGGEAEKPS